MKILPGHGSFIDASGNAYTLSAGNIAMENSKPIPGGAGTAAMELYNGQVYGQDGKTGNWYTWNQTSWTSASAPPAPKALPSPDNTVILAKSNAAITDATGTKWTITGDGKVAINGTPDQTTSRVIALAFEKGRVWQENADKLWWSKAKPTDAWGPAAGTSTSPVPSASLNIDDAQATITINQSNLRVTASAGDHMVFIKGSGNTMALQGGAETISDAGSNNTFVVPAAGAGLEIFTTNPLVTDKLDFRDALKATDWDGTAGKLGDYLRLNNGVNGTSISISPDGKAAHAAGVVLLQGQHNVGLSTLMAHSLT
jgi:hypothetical protein